MAKEKGNPVVAVFCMLPLATIGILYACMVLEERVFPRPEAERYRHESEVAVA